MQDVTDRTHAAALATARHRRRIWPVVVGVLVAALVALIVLWDWDWFRPIVEARASAALGRQVTMSRFGLQLSWHPTAIADNVEIANPPGFPEAPYFAHIGRLAVTADAKAYWHGRHIVLSRIDVQKPDINAIQHEDGKATWDFPALSGPSGNSSSSGEGPKIGDLVISDGTAHVVDPKVKADFKLGINTREPGQGQPGQIVIDADGRYAKQPITGQAVGGALLTLRDSSNPYPIDAHFANGPTKVSLDGTVQDPLHFAGTNLKLHLSGPDMSLLFPLTGIPIPKTPPYDIAGELAYADKKVRFSNFEGRLGSSDIGGTIAVDPTTPKRPTVEATLSSRRVDLADLGGFIGSQPGRVNTPGQSAEQKREVKKAEASSKLIPDTPINLPKLNAADVHLQYHGDKIEGRSVPFDTITAKLDIVDGRITVHPVSLGVGVGHIAADADLKPIKGNDFAAKADVQFDRVDLGRMLEATHLVHGAGLIGGRADIDTSGDSLSALLANGDGGLRLLMAGGNLSALLVDLSGLELGNAIISALGIPNRATLQCFAADLALRKGVLETRTLILSTSEADIIGSGDINLGREALDYQLRTESRHFSVGSLPTPIRITGTFKDPHVAPAAGPLAARAGAAIGLGLLLTPFAALLPTVQLGTGKENLDTCEATVRHSGREPTRGSAATPPKRPVRR